MNVDDGLEDIRWIRGLGGEKLPAASYALLSNLKKAYFCHRRGLEIFCRLFSTQQSPNVFVSDAWPAPATHHRSFCEHRGQRVGRSPLRARHVQISWRSGWLCRSMSVQDSESRRFELIWLSFSQADLGPISALGRKYYFRVFLNVRFFFSPKICAHSERYRNRLAGIFEI